MPPDKFFGKTWIFWAQTFIAGIFTLFCLIFGFVFWFGIMTNADGEARPDAGPPMLIIGFCLIPIAALGIYNIIARIEPIIRCYRDGIECKIIGATSLDSIWIPRIIRLVWPIISLQGFRSHKIRIPWSDFVGAEVIGFPMSYVLNLHVTTTDPNFGEITQTIPFRQVALKDSPQKVSNTLNHWFNSLSDREKLHPWQPD